MIKKFILIILNIYIVFNNYFKIKSCRYYPTCSHYMKQAIEYYGVRRGIVLGVRRLIRCHPFAGSGVDVIPAYKEKNHEF